MNTPPRSAATVLALLLCTVLGACEGDSSSEVSPTSTSPTAVTTSTEEPTEEIPLPLELDKVVERLEAEGYEVTPKKASGVLGEISVEPGVSVTLWGEERKQQNYLEILEQVRSERAPTEVLFESVGSFVVWLDRNGQPSAEERDTYEAAVAATGG